MESRAAVMTMDLSPEQALKRYFGYDHFRPRQREIIQSVLDGRDTLVLMPTGGGKSVCFQIPALLLPGLTLVISPLIALMKDQVEGLRANGIAAAFLNSSLSVQEEDQIARQAERGELRLLYLSPERALSTLGTVLSRVQVSLIAIDEAHCISSWGHDFRQEYTQLKLLRDKFPAVPIIALTATADGVTQRDILKQLCLRDPAVFVSSFDRPNFMLEVRQESSMKVKLREIADFIRAHPGDSGIIYCLSRQTTEDVSTALNQEGIPCQFYHAGMTPAERSRVQEAFVQDDLPIITATIAFGMGIDKSNVRWVIHFNLPKSMEGYYQEIGRAGRDGLPSVARMYYSYGDIAKQADFARQSAQAALNLDKLKRLEQFAESRFCRRRILLNYFGERYTGSCGNCDVCQNPPRGFDGTIPAQKALSAVLRCGEEIGVNHLIQVLRGSQSAELQEKGWDKVKTWGAGQDTPAAAWMSYLLQMIQLGLLEVRYDAHNHLRVTETGHAVLKGQVPVELMAAEPRVKKADPLPVKQQTAEETDYAAPDLFDELRACRKRLAQAEGMPPYIIFSDRTLREMAEHIPVNREEMLRISGVSENKFDRYGQEFLDILLPASGGRTRALPADPRAALTDESLAAYLREMEEKGAGISLDNLAKALLGTARLRARGRELRLSFFALLKGRLRAAELRPRLADYFREQGIPVTEGATRKSSGSDFFSEPHHYHLDEKRLKQIEAEIERLPLLKPNDENLAENIVTARQQHARAYEPWSEAEIGLFREVIAGTNDPGYIARLFRRNEGAIRSCYKHLREIREKTGT